MKQRNSAKQVRRVNDLKYVIFLLCSVMLLLTTGLHQLPAQEPPDSILQRLNSAHTDTGRLVLLYSLIEEIEEDTVWPAYNEEMGKLAEKLVSSNDKLLQDFAKKYQAAYYNNLGYLQQETGNVGQALNHYYHGLKLYEVIGDQNGIGNTLVNIGTIYNEQGDFRQALRYYSRSLDMMEKAGDTSGMATVLNNLGSVYHSLGETEKAIESFEHSIRLRTLINDREGLGIVFTNIGGVYDNSGEDDKALEYYRKSLEVQLETGDQVGIAYSQINFGNIFLQKREFENAESYFLKAYRMAEESGDARLMLGCANWLSRLYASWGKYKPAYEMQVLYKQMTDSIRTDENRRQTLRRQIQYDYEKKEAVLKAEQEKKDVLAKEEISRQKIIRNATAGGALLLICSAVVVLAFYKRKKEAEMEQKITDSRMRAINSQMNPHFIFNCMHSIQSLVSRKDFIAADQCLVRFAKLIRKVLDHSTQKEISLEDDMDTLKDYVELEKMRLEHPLDFQVRISGDLQAGDIMIPPLLVQPVIENAIIHGIRPKNASGSILVDIKKLQKLLCIEISDNGVGRSPSKEADARRKSYGIPLTRERLEYLGKAEKLKSLYKIDDIYSADQEKAGTRVVLTLPIKKEFD